MRQINVVKAFNFCHPDGTIQRFPVGLHEVGTYQRPKWDRVKDMPIDGEFETLEIADHPYVKRHLGKPPTREELLAKAEKLRAQAEAMAKQADAQAVDSDDPAPDAVAQFMAAASAMEKFSSEIEAEARQPIGVIPNTRQGFGA